MALTHADAITCFERRRSAWLAGNVDAYLDCPGALTAAARVE